MAPIAIGALVIEAITEIAPALIAAGKRKQIADVVDQKVATDPVIQNATNSEPLYRSRTFLSAGYQTAVGAVAAFFLVRDQVLVHGLRVWEWSATPEQIALYGLLLAGIWGLYGRTKQGLKPAFSRIAGLLAKIKGR